jgi:hypothetical protein
MTKRSNGRIAPSEGAPPAKAAAPLEGAAPTLATSPAAVYGPASAICDLLGVDPVDQLLVSTEPAAQWHTLVYVLDRPSDDPEVVTAHAAVLAAAEVCTLLDRLPDWEVDNQVTGHDRPDYAPNLLNLLADMGIGPEDDVRVETLLETMCRHQDEEGRFQSFGRLRSSEAPWWGALLCDSHVITEVQLRFKRGSDARVRRALATMSEDLTELAQGRAWPCRPESVSGFRGPGRKGDFCPMVTLQALRAFSYLPAGERPPGLLDVARVSLHAWARRGEEKPYMFGHGRQFKRGKWPSTWYSALAVLDAVGRYPELWRLSEARPEDVRAIVELAACLIAYSVDPATGMVTPHSCYKGFESFSWGQKKAPSAFATARTLGVLCRVSDLAAQIAAVDVLELPSSRGGTGMVLAP